MPVKVLDETNLEQTVNGGGVVVVEFYAPWCPHCKRMEPVYAEAADEAGGRALLAKVDGDAKPELMERFKAEVYPTIIYFKDGAEKFRTEGEVSKDDIILKIDSIA